MCPSSKLVAQSTSLSSGNTLRRRLAQVALLVAGLLLSARGERLPIRVYTTADGLARDSVQRMVRDSHGFLWLCTSEGLSRFDGYSFVNYGTADGLSNRIVNDLLETRSGVYWVATRAGLCRFTPTVPAGDNHAPKFTVQRLSPLPNESITSLWEDQVGAVWCGTNQGLYRLAQSGGQWQATAVDLHQPPGYPDGFWVRGIAGDGEGALWVTTATGLYRRWPDGRAERFGEAEGLLVPQMQGALLEERNGVRWVCSSQGLYQLSADPQPGHNAVARLWTTRDGLASNNVSSLFQTAQGHLLIATKGGLSKMSLDENGNRRLRSYTVAQGLSDTAILGATEDASGNIWIASESGGAMKWAASGLTSWEEADGRRGARSIAFFNDRAGRLCFMSGAEDGRQWLNQFDGQRFVATEIKLPAGVSYRGWGWNQWMLQDSAGEWWLPTGHGLVRYGPLQSPKQLASGRAQAIYTTRDGLPDNAIFRLFEDHRGDLWISTLSQPRSLTRWERATQSFHSYSPADYGQPNPALSSAPTAFAEDAAGNLWIGFYLGGLARYADGRFTYFTTSDGVPPGFIGQIHSDASGRLWVATGDGGVARVDDPTAAHPSFHAYTTAQGLSSNHITCITEDTQGRIYLGTGRGVDRLEVASGRIRHYTTADGLANNFINVATRDAAGSLWFGTLQGLSRLAPLVDRDDAPPPILIKGLHVAGVVVPIAELGTNEITTPVLTSAQNHLDIEFFGLSFVPGEQLRYQYRLDGARGDWSAPSPQRTITLANLSSGAYRFLVRAVSADGAVSPNSASVSFRILPPIWRRWWVLLLAGAAFAAGAIVFGRYRAARVAALRESETRFRTLAETASDAIITIDVRGLIVFTNEAAGRVFGYPAAEMIGRDLTLLMPEYLRHLHQAGFERYQQTGHRHISWHAVALPGLHRAGHEIPLEISFGEFTQHGQRYFTGVARDVTERKRAEEALRESREERLRELERVRRRIATDLHDDIGSSLTQISILSEVVKQRIGPSNNALPSSVDEPLRMIAGASRELVDSMSDIVWAINPRKDHLSDLVQRMRRFAADSFTARHIRFASRLPDADQNIPLGANLRREVFLIFKESVNNTIKHSSCTAAEVELQVADGWLQMRITDDGRGFDAAQESDGHGLVSMRDRAAGIGGQLEMASAPSRGTTVTLRVPLDRPIDARSNE